MAGGMKGYAVVLITAPRGDARIIADAVLKERLAACVNIVDGVHSVYWWQGRIEEGEEALLIVKTRVEALGSLIEAVRRVHPYEVPEIIALPIMAGFSKYLEWIDEEVKGSGTGES